MILSTDHNEHEYDKVPAHAFDCFVNGLRSNYVRRVDSKQLTYDVIDVLTHNVSRLKARYIGINLCNCKVEILTAIERPAELYL